MHILPINLRHAHVETVTQVVLETADNVPLVLQGPALPQRYPNLKGAYYHDGSPTGGQSSTEALAPRLGNSPGQRGGRRRHDRVRFTIPTVKHSMVSPTCISSNPPTLIPHS